MSETFFGYTSHNYGRRYSFTSTHLNGDEILQDENLNPGTLIVSSPVVQASGNITDTIGDQVAHSLFFTDHNGNATRLTYTIHPGNGLVVNAYNQNWDSVARAYTCDTLSFEIDHDSLKTTDDKGQLYVSKPDIIDNYTLMVTQTTLSSGAPHSYISVITENLEKATNVKFGITRGDNYTISAYNGILTVNTSNLDYADDTTETSGIVRPNVANFAYRTVEANNGILHVITSNLERANNDQLGVVKTDGITTVTNPNGVISVRTEGLTRGDAYNFGVVKVDDVTIHSLNGIINADSTQMTPTAINTEDGTSTFGVIKLDPVCFGISSTNHTYLNRYNEIITLLERYLGDYQYIIDWLEDHESRIRALENQASAEYIYVFRAVSDTNTILDEPVWNAESGQVEDPAQLVSLQFQIKTNCSFNVSVTFRDNENPGITLQNVKLGNGEVVSASGLSHHIFSSTNKELNTLHMTFNCRNFNGSDIVNVAHILTTAKITVTSINDDSVSRECAHTFLRWNCSNYIQEPFVPYEPEIFEETEEVVDVVYSDYNINIRNENSDNILVSGKTCIILNEANAGNLTSGSVLFELSRTKKEYIKKIIRTYKYINGVLTCTNTEETDVAEPRQTIEYLSVPLISKIRNAHNNYEFGLKIESKTSYNRPISDNTTSIQSELNYDHTNTGLGGWNSLDEESIWYKCSTPTLASSTTRETRANNNRVVVGGYNVFNIASVVSSFTKDRRLELTLSVKKCVEQNTNTFTAANRYWADTDIPSFNVIFVEDFTPSNCSISVRSQVQSNANAPLKIDVFKSNVIPYVDGSDSFTIKINYVYNTPNRRTATLSSANGSNNQNINYERRNELAINIKEPSNLSNGVERLSIVFKHGEQTPVSVLINGTPAEQGYVTITPQDIIPNIVPASVNNIINTTNKRTTTNNISGFTIIRCECTGFKNNPEVEFNSVGTWPTYQPEPEQDITFGNAAITKITVDPWDDTMLRLKFNISPGSNTHIPTGSQVYVKATSNVSKITEVTNGISDARSTGNYPVSVKMYVNNTDNTPYNYNEFYDHIVASCDGWTNTGCVFNISLENIWKPAPHPNSISHVLYDTEEEQICFSAGNTTWRHYTENLVSTQMYATDGGGRGNYQIPKTLYNKINADDGGPKSSCGLSNNDLNAQSINHPIIYKLWAIRFNFTIEARTPDGKTTTMNFTPTVHDLCSKISFDNATYNKSTSQNVYMVNAFFSSDSKWDTSNDVTDINVINQLAAATSSTQTNIKDLQDTLISISEYVASGMSVEKAILAATNNLKNNIEEPNSVKVQTMQTTQAISVSQSNSVTTNSGRTTSSTTQNKTENESGKHNSLLEVSNENMFNSL